MKGFRLGLAIVVIGLVIAPGVAGAATVLPLSAAPDQAGGPGGDGNPVAEFFALSHAQQQPKVKRPKAKRRWFDARASVDANGQIVSYTWDFGDGKTTTTTSPVVSHFYKSFKTYKVKLTVTDNEGNIDTKQRKIGVREFLERHRPLGRKGPRILKILGWAPTPNIAAILKPGFGDKHRKKAKTKPGQAMTSCGRNRGGLAVHFRHASGVDWRGKTIWRKDGKRLSVRLVTSDRVPATRGRDSFVFFALDFGSLQNGLYEAELLANGKRLARVSVVRAC